MPISYMIHKDKQLVVTTALGCLSFEEAKAHQDQLLGNPDFNPDFNRLPTELE